ncbi:porin family protein [Parasalinivibrio latis]|uniref:porin family protein n=1 Tax=Parasalinivibrio latis TaxID=2952610 RepID=UPI0030E24718
MKSMFFYIALSCASALLSLPVTADDDDTGDLFSYAYLGYANFNLDFDSSEYDLEMDGFTLTLGQEFTENIALETTLYHATDKFNSGSTKIKLEGFSASITPVLYADISKYYSVYGKAGLAYGRASEKVGSSPKISDDEFTVIYGIGLSITTGSKRAYAFRIGYDIYDGDDIEADLFTISAGMKF